MDIFGIIAAASNVRTGGNPAYGVEDFLAAYPQFGGGAVPEAVLRALVNLAQSSIHKARYHDAWEICMGLYIAHWLTLYLQTAAKADDPVQKKVAAGLAKGLQTSKSAGDISVSYDFGSVSEDFAGWGTYKLTAYGQQFVTMARTFALGGMVAW
jgi:hypothetical protein